MSELDQLPPDFLKTFIRHINMLRFIGLDMFHERNFTPAKKYARFCIFNVFFIPMLVGQVMYITCGSDTGATFLDVANAVPTTFMALQDAVKMIVIFYKRNEIKYVIMGIAEIWPTQLQSYKTTKTLNKWIRRLKIMDDTFFRCSIAALFIYELAPLCKTVHGVYSRLGYVKYLYPLQSYFALGLDAHWQYAIVYLYLLTTSVITHMVLYIPSDFMLVTLTFDLSALLDILQTELEDAVQHYDCNVEQSRKHFKHITMTHQKLLRLADKLSDIFGLLVFVQVSFSSVVICCFGFLTVIAEGMLLNNLLAGIGVAVSIWNLCWPGQLLADTSFGISEAAYRSEWYNKNAEVQKYIVIIMIRAQKPCHLAALGFSNLTLANFSKILSTSWSYLSLLNQMYQNSEA